MLSVRAVCLLPALIFAGQPAALERGQEALRRRDMAAAERALKQAVAEQPNSALAQKLLGMTYAARGYFFLAREPLERACALDPREEFACYYLGRTYFGLGRYQDARKVFETALRNPGKEREALYHGLAGACDAMGLGVEAERAFRQSIVTGNPAALRDYGMFLFHHGRGREAVPYLERAKAETELAVVRNSLQAAPSATTPAPAGAPAPVAFEARPLAMIVRNGAFGNKHQIETMTAGAAVFDIDDDGWPDIFLANGAHIPDLVKRDPSFLNRLFRNNRDGTFADVTARAGLAGEGYSMGAAAADYDDDGHVDLFVTGVRGDRLYRNGGDGTFEDVTARAGVAGDGRWAVAAGWFDYDNDGRLDLFVARYVEWDPATEPRCGMATEGFRTYCHPDMYVPLANLLYHNEGGGTFRDVSKESGIAAFRGKGMGVAFADYDGDGRLDVFVANDTVPNFLFHNLGDGRFEEAAVPAGVAYNETGRASSSMGVDFRDWDNDGREDLFATAVTNETFTLYRNTGRGFADLTGPSRVAIESRYWTGWSLGVFDLNNDGWKDLFAACGNVNDNAEVTGRQTRQPNLVFLNTGKGTFQAQKLPGEALHRAAAFGDFDRDGRIDIVVTRLNEAPLVLWNRTREAGHWIEIRLVGRRSNRDGLGAWLRITTAGGNQWNRVTTSVGYGGSSDRVAHFGLGAETRVQKLEIDWPSGARQVLHDLVADRIVRVEESGN